MPDPRCSLCGGRGTIMFRGVAPVSVDHGFNDRAMEEPPFTTREFSCPDCSGPTQFYDIPIHHHGDYYDDRRMEGRAILTETLLNQLRPLIHFDERTERLHRHVTIRGRLRGFLTPQTLCESARETPCPPSPSEVVEQFAMLLWEEIDRSEKLTKDVLVALVDSVLMTVKSAPKPGLADRLEAEERRRADERVREQRQQWTRDEMERMGALQRIEIEQQREVAARAQRSLDVIPHGAMLPFSPNANQAEWMMQNMAGVSPAMLGVGGGNAGASGGNALSRMGGGGGRSSTPPDPRALTQGRPTRVMPPELERALADMPPSRRAEILRQIELATIAERRNEPVQTQAPRRTDPDRAEAIRRLRDRLHNQSRTWIEDIESDADAFRHRFGDPTNGW